MILDLNAYRVQIPYIKAWFENKKEYELEKEIGLLALATGCHIVVIEYYIGELYGFSDALRDKINRDMIFYDIKNVIGIRQ